MDCMVCGISGKLDQSRIAKQMMHACNIGNEHKQSTSDGVGRCGKWCGQIEKLGNARVQKVKAVLTKSRTTKVLGKARVKGKC